MDQIWGQVSEPEKVNFEIGTIVMKNPRVGMKSWGYETSKTVELGRPSIFTHFLVINSMVAELIANQILLYFYPDFPSITKIIISDGKVKEFFIGG